MKSCLIVTGGDLDLEFAASFLKEEPFDKVIAVDAGLEAVDALNLVPDYIVGDFDTVKESVLEKYRKLPFIVWEQHKPEKNETDTELARSRALTLGCDRILFLGATGGRIDHMLGNIHALYACLEHGIQACLLDRQNRIYLLDEGKVFRKKDLWGKYVSFFPYTEQVKGITLTGFRYPLEKKDLVRGYEVGRCISNELAREQACLDFDEGILVCVESCDRD